MLNLTQLEERTALMSSSSTDHPPPPFFYSHLLNRKQSGLLWPCYNNQPYSLGWENNITNEPSVNRGPFTPLQRMELEHQALIYKYLNANAPVPSALLVSLCRKVADPASVTGYLGNNRVGWGQFQISGLPLSNGDLEPGRCRRTDGKKWRCAKNAMPEHKYCERHMVRSRHRSRKPVEKKPNVTPGGNDPSGGGVETSVSPSSALLGRPYRSKEKTTTTTKPFNLENNSPPNSLNSNSNSIIDPTPNLQFPTFPPISSSSPMLNISGSSYPKNNTYISSSSASPSGSESPPHVLQDFMGELSKVSTQSDQTHVVVDLIGSPLGEILGNSNYDRSTNLGSDDNNNCYHYPNAFVDSLGWSLG